MLDAATDKLLGVVFGYVDGGGKRTIYAYTMERVTAELDAVARKLPEDRD